VAMPRDSALPSLEADLRLLSSESRRSESITGQLTGWLSGPEHPQIKESAERAMLKLRTLANNEDPEVMAKHRKVCKLSSDLILVILVKRLAPIIVTCIIRT
jgi:hypothetical protein